MIIFTSDKSVRQTNYGIADARCVNSRFVFLRRTAGKKMRVLASIVMLTLMASIASADCVPNDQAGYAMSEVKMRVDQMVGYDNKRYWYSTQYDLQAEAAQDSLMHYNLYERTNWSAKKLHFLNLDNAEFLVLFSTDTLTCGFSDNIYIDGSSARRAISASEEAYELAADIELEVQGDRADSGMHDEQANVEGNKFQPGDPIYGMDEETRREFQMIQGIINGEDPIGGMEQLFGNGKP